MWNFLRHVPIWHRKKDDMNLPKGAVSSANGGWLKKYIALP
jgi:hypothetical protein